MKRLIIVLLMFALACQSIDPLRIARANEDINAFLEQYPDADITVARINGFAESDLVEEYCGVSPEDKTYYKIHMLDEDSRLELYAYIEADTQELLCMKKLGVQDDNTDLKEETDDVKDKENEETDDVKDVTDDGKDDTDEVIKDVKAPVNCTSPALEFEDGFLEWMQVECEGFQGYKVVHAYDIEMPKYPEDGYVEYITDPTKHSYEPEESGHYAITVLLKDGKVYSNPVYVNVSQHEADEADTNDEVEPYNAQLDYVDYDDHIVLEWHPYRGDDFKYYKVVWANHTDPVYPDDGYISVISDPEDTRYEVHDISAGENYYRVMVILDGFYEDATESYSTNVVNITR